MSKSAPAPPPPKATAANPTGLPPAGDEQREELRRREDDLAQRAEAKAAELEIERIDPNKFKPDNEALSLYDMAMQIDGALPDKRYCWCPAERETWKASVQLQIKKMEGWEVVQGDMPEARDKEIMGRDGSTTRWWVDTILMRTSVENYERLQREAAERQHRIQYGIDEGLRDMAESHRDSGIRLHQTIDDGDVRNFQAQGQAKRTLDTLTREGRMPGVSVPGR